MPVDNELTFVERAAYRVVDVMDRRRFLRRLAQGSFVAVAGSTVGLLPGILRNLPAAAATCGTCNSTGFGCPTVSGVGLGCGTSRCCNYLRPGAPTNCKCGTTTTGTAADPPAGSVCFSGTSYCGGNDLRTWPGWCWTCSKTIQYSGYCNKWTTTCCDCKTSATLCGDPDMGGGTDQGRCISYSAMKTTFYPTCNGC